MYSPHKHSYLQSWTQNINPRIVNRSVDRARIQPTIDPHDFEPPNLRLTSEQPCIPVQNVDVTRRPCAFGRWALPKLRRELQSKDPTVVLQTVYSIADLVHDPEKAFEAIRLRIPDGMTDLLLNSDSAVREVTCLALTTIAGLSDGKSVIMKNHLMLDNIIALLKDIEAAVRIKAASLLDVLAITWMVADDLVEYGFIDVLLHIVLIEKEPSILSIHLETLKSLMYGEGKCVALGSNAFDIFLSLMSHEDSVIRSKAATCMMMITSAKTGKVMAYDNSILQKLYMLLREEQVEVYTGAAAALMFCTIKSRAKFRAAEMPGLVNRLLQLIQDWNHSSAQYYSIKALTNIAEHPKVRRWLKENHLEIIENLHVGANKDMIRHKEILCSIVNWLPWHCM